MCIEHTVDQYIDPKSQSRKYGAFLMKMVGWVYIYSYYLVKLIKITLKGFVKCVNTKGRMSKEETIAIKLRMLESNQTSGKRYKEK